MTAAPTTAGTALSARDTRKTAARKAPARSAAAKKTSTRKAAAKKTSTRKATARKTTARKTAAKRTTAPKAAETRVTAANELAGDKALTPARRPPRFNRMSAAEHAINKHTIRMTLPVLGPVTLPATEKLAYFAGLAVVAALGIVDWPVVAVISVGHFMAENQRNRLVRDFGRALEEAV